MSKTYTYIEKQYTALPRSERRRQTGQASGSGSSSVTVFSGNGGASGGVTDHAQLSGIVSVEDDFSDYRNDIHLTSAAAKALATMSGLEILTTTDTTTEATDKNVYSSLRTLKEIADALKGIDGMYLRKDIDDTASGTITFKKSLKSEIFIDGFDGKGWQINADGSAIFNTENVRTDIFLGGKIGTPEFVSGFTGSGWQIDGADARATFDYTTIRKSMKVYELVYSQIWGLGGSDLITDCNKIKIVVDNGSGSYTCTIDTLNNVMRMNLRNGDYVRIQRSEGLNIHYLVGKVSNVTTSSFDLTITDGEDIPVAGDVAFRVGNESDKSRQGLIYLTSSDDYASYIDVLDGITDGSFAGKTKVRLGNLQGITVSGNPLDGYGLYVKGGIYEDCTYLLEDGTTIEQKFSTLNGRLDSEISSLRNDMSMETGNVLRNSSFTSNTKYWNNSSTAHFIVVGGAYLFFSGYNYIEKNSIADIYTDNGRNVLRLLNSSITQTNDCLIIPAHESAGSYTYSFALYYKVLRAGTLRVGFTGKDLYEEQTLAVSDTYKKLSKAAKWDETGDFTMSFDGEILIYGVALFQDELADAQIKLQTQITQNAEAIKLTATKDYVDSETGKIYTKYNSELSVTADNIKAVSTRVDNINNTISTAGWITTADGNSLWASKSMENGETIISKINQTPTSVQIDASHIYLTGVVTFSMFASDSQSKINAAQSKADSAYSEASNASYYANQAYNTANTANSNANSALTGFNSLASWTKNSSILEALKGETIIVNGYINTNYIDVNQINANKIQSATGTFTSISSTNDIMKLDGDGLTFLTTKIKAGIGSNTSVLPSTVGYTIPISASRESEYAFSTDNVAMFLSASGVTSGLDAIDSNGKIASMGNCALAIGSGNISGFRLCTRRVSSNYTLSAMDNIILVNATGEITLTLPSSPQGGQVYFFKNINSGSYTISGNGHIVNLGKYNQDYSFPSSDGSMIMIVYDEVYKKWHGGYMNHN